MAVAWVFAGQGAQRRGMGADVLDRYPDLCRQADEILGYRVRELCLTNAAPGLKDTRHVQPALFVVNALSYLDRREREPAPDFLAGHSLGEYDALFAAGCFDFATGVRLVQRRGELMSQAGDGGMVAVVGVEPDRLADLLHREGLHEIDLANRNSARQVVLSGPDLALQRATEAITAAGAGRCVKLRVSAPFHSRHMAPAAAQYRQFLTAFALRDPQIPVIANVTALPYPAGGVGDLLGRQVDSPVRWWESMSHLLAAGVTDLVEVGPGRVLAELWNEAKAQPCPAPATPAPAACAPVIGAPAVPEPAEPAATARPGRITAAALGSAEFRADYGVRRAYLAGSMFKGIASPALVIRMAKAGLMGFLGTGGLTLDEIDAGIREIRAGLGAGARFGVNLLAVPDDPAAERELVALYLRHDVRHVEAASFLQLTPALLHFRYTGAAIGTDGVARAARHVVAKVSRPEVAAAFMAPPPAAMLDRLVAEGALTAAEAAAAALLPVAADICVEADSGGHTDAGSPYALMPAMGRLRDEAMRRHGYPARIRIGAAGGIGAPEAAAAAFVLGADFVVTGSVNQCTVEAGTSDAVKDLLAGLDVQDTAYAPAGDLFELGARVQVVRKGTLFPARANKLYQVYRQYDGLDDIDPETRRTIEERYFRRTFAEVWDETREYLRKHRPADLDRAERSPKARMALVFRWYFVHSTRLALAGEPGVPGGTVNYQIHCGPALGAFNRLVAGTPLHDWRQRHVDTIADLLMDGAAQLLDGTLRTWSNSGE
ncbi:ACP S-malonyltransferase [Dactylosporangium matsuzakiense]|uniref:[acyl-carrier-protein] S-malonyltransferase n=1 Tax=Dactylosporangium matsuzakiense TaxID=53360 RepID=A0A9W6KQC7_9ACTN|nr:ACP S-malonyltransferase [Dactylosporangium matsuzakiense]UWZ42310.1 ACP S-malonyltransferase [Dactylosporangium matsuzakiense]GLL05317.1 polyketide biosynthesis protein PksE [Dactylosporangium matsuzakiense]